jgi:hypothetical protein
VAAASIASTVSDLNKKIYGTNRGMAQSQSADRELASLCVSRRHCAQTQQGR